jgi:hypothetical protein
MSYRSAIVGLALCLCALTGGAVAAPTPVPGGANQVKALSGTFGQTVFNGEVRVTASDLRIAPDADVNQYYPGSVSADKKVLAFSILIRNGTPDQFQGLLSYTLADKDDVATPDAAVHPGSVNILQGAAARQGALVAVDKSFVPVKLIVQCGSCGPRFRSIRFTIPASMLPASPAM